MVNCWENEVENQKSLMAFVHQPLTDHEEAFRVYIFLL